MWVMGFNDSPTGKIMVLGFWGLQVDPVFIIMTLPEAMYLN
jgi:hypothetical protein